MAISRRLLLGTLATSAVATPGLVLPQPTVGQASPTAGEPLTPEATLERLLDSDILTPLLPADYESVKVTRWVDESDRDLEGAVGGVLFVTGEDDNGNPQGPGAMIVLPTFAEADKRIASISDTEPGVTACSLLGYNGFTIVERGDSGTLDDPAPDDGYALTVLAAGTVIISGVAERLPMAESGPRSVVNATALLDQYLRVTAPPKDEE